MGAWGKPRKVLDGIVHSHTGGIGGRAGVHVANAISRYEPTSRPLLGHHEPMLGMTHHQPTHQLGMSYQQPMMGMTHHQPMLGRTQQPSFTSRGRSRLQWSDDEN
jgi:hypothetical protein